MGLRLRLDGDRDVIESTAGRRPTDRPDAISARLDGAVVVHSVELPARGGGGGGGGGGERQNGVAEAVDRQSNGLQEAVPTDRPTEPARAR